MMVRVHLRIEEAKHSAARRLGCVEREVGFAYAVDRRGLPCKHEADTDTHPDALTGTRQGILRAHGVDDALCQHGGVARVRDAGQNAEFIASQTGDDAFPPRAATQAPRDRDEKRVADRVSERVVHALEPVEIQEVKRQALAARRALCGLASVGLGGLYASDMQRVHERLAVAETGEAVVQG